MSRIRTLKPDAFESLTLAAVPIEARWTFAGLWTMADDEGRLPDSPALIRSKVFPLDDLPLDTIEGWLAVLVGIDALCRYEADGLPLLHVPKFRVHQVVNKPTPSRLPACPKHQPAAPAARAALTRPRRAVLVPVSDEPSRRCPEHENTRQAPRCGACKDARLAHDRWVAAETDRKAQEAEMAANTLCGSASCTCDHEACDVGWIPTPTTYRGATVEVQAKCPGCFPRTEPSTTSARTASFVDGREVGAEYPDARAAAAGDR